MSLTVDVFVFREDGTMRVLGTPVDGADLAGFERWRTTVWGSEAVRALGARYFPVLASGDLTVLPDQVSEFLVECAMIQANLDVVASHPDPDRPQDPHTDSVRTISKRLANIQVAAERAMGVGGGVIVW